MPTSKKSNHTFADLVGKIQKDTSEAFASVRVEDDDRDRIPSGVFPFDLATGGGIPQGVTSVIYGPESAGKTNLAMRIIRQAQIAFPDQMCVYVDTERALDPVWVKRMGLDPERLGHLKPAYGEDAVDWTEAALSSSDVSLVVVDSVAEITPGNTIEKEAGRMDVAGNSMLISRMMSKVAFAQGMAQGEGRFPTLLAINQVRINVGQMMGDPEKMPGGKKLHHAARMIARIYGRNEIDATVNEKLPTWKKTNIVLKKWKVPIINPECQYHMAMIPTSKLQPGEVEDWPTVKAYLNQLGWMQKQGTKWKLLDETFDKQGDIRDKVSDDSAFARNLRSKMIEVLLEKVGIAAQS
jgi:recombination protein RecA